MVSYDRNPSFHSVGITVSSTPDSWCNPSRYIHDFQFVGQALSDYRNIQFPLKNLEFLKQAGPVGFVFYCFLCVIKTAQSKQLDASFFLHLLDGHSITKHGQWVSIKVDYKDIYYHTPKKIDKIRLLHMLKKTEVSARIG